MSGNGTVGYLAKQVAVKSQAGWGSGMTAVSVDLQGIPEIVEIDRIITNGVLPPDEFIEAVLPQLSSAQRISLNAYLQNLEDNSEFVTETYFFGDQVMLLIVPITAMVMFLAECGAAGLA